MSTDPIPEHGPEHSPEHGNARGLSVYAADDFRVCDGVNLGDPVSDSSDLVFDDIYRLWPAATRRRLALNVHGALTRLSVAGGSECGRVGASVHIDCSATFMAPDGTTVDALVLVELASDAAMIEAVWLLPFAALAPKTDYALVDVDRSCALERFAELACVSFTRGTHITLATGEQRPIEDLRVGDRVLTRNNGVQPIRWIGQRTARASGAFTPVVISKGTLNNENDLTLSPNQRVLIYQRKDLVKAGRAEVMVKADMLVNGTTVTRGEGGFVEYFELLFDNHEIVYAEGIATETMPPETAASGPSLPKAVQERLGAAKGRRRRAPRAVTLVEGMLDSSIAAEVLRRASSL